MSVYEQIKPNLDKYYEENIVKIREEDLKINQVDKNGKMIFTPINNY